MRHLSSHEYDCGSTFQVAASAYKLCIGLALKVCVFASLICMTAPVCGEHSHSRLQVPSKHCPAGVSSREKHCISYLVTAMLLLQSVCSATSNQPKAQTLLLCPTIGMTSRWAPHLLAIRTTTEQHLCEDAVVKFQMGKECCQCLKIVQARKRFPMMAEFAQRINCGGASAGATSSFMREMMQSSTRVSYDNTLALQTFYDEEEDDPPVSDADAQNLAFMKRSSVCHAV